jgi:hypothetical protein
VEQRFPSMRFGLLVSSVTMSAGRLPRRLFRNTRLLVDASNVPSSFARGVAIRTIPPENNVLPRLSVTTFRRTMLCCDPARTIPVVVRKDRVVQHRGLAAAARLASREQKHADTVPPGGVVGHDHLLAVPDQNAQRVAPGAVVTDHGVGIEGVPDVDARIVAAADRVARDYRADPIERRDAVRGIVDRHHV